MKTEDIKRLALAYQAVTEKKLDPVGQEDGDIDNDGDKDKTDKYLMNRRKAIKKAMQDESVEESIGGMVRKAVDVVTGKAKKDRDAAIRQAYWKKQYTDMHNILKQKPNQKAAKAKTESVDLDKGNVNTALRHDCATHVTSEQWGPGTCIKGMHTIEETANGEGVVTHYDVMFEHGIERDVPVNELKVTRSESHMHSRKKKMPEMSSKEKMKRGLYNSTNEDYGAMKDAEAHAKKDGANYNDVSVQHRYDAYHMKKRGYTHFEPGSYGTRRYTKGPTAHPSSTKIGPEHYKGISESVKESYVRPNSVNRMKDALISMWEAAASDRAMHTKGATDPEAIDSKASQGEKEFKAKHTVNTPTALDEPALNAANFNDATKGVKVAPKRRGDNPAGDKIQVPKDTTKA